MAQLSTPKRNRTYPAVTLKHVIEFATTLVAECGRGPHSRKVVAKMLGCSEVSGIFTARLAACVHFGILSNNGNGYRLTRLGERLTHPASNPAHADLAEAMMKPRLYYALIREFQERSLPANLAEYCVQTYAVRPEVAPRVVRTFLDSAAFAGILDDDRITLHSSRAADASISREQSSLRSLPLAPTATDQGQSDPIELALPGTDVVIVFPKRYAYSLSIGEFSEGIKTLRDSIAQSDLNRQKRNRI